MNLKTKYLILLICLFIFPMKSFALEEKIDEKIPESNMEVIESNIKNESLEKENIIEEEKNSTRSVSNLDNVDEEMIDPESTIEMELTTIFLENVDINLVVNENVTFSGISAEPEKYTIEREEWTQGINQVFTSDLEYNTQIENGLIDSISLIDSIEEFKDYGYNVVLKLADNIRPILLPNYLTVYLNEIAYDKSSCISYDENNHIAYIRVMTVEANNLNANYVDELNINNAITTAIAGQTPTYTASLTTEHFTLIGERWEYDQVAALQSDYNNYYSHANASNQILINKDYDTVFSTFDVTNEYSYLVVVEAEDGYRLNQKNITIKINGKETNYYEIFRYLQENGRVRYHIYLANQVSPVVQKIETPTYYQEPLMAEYTSYINEEENIMDSLTVLNTKTNINQYPVLEVAKDGQEKQSINNNEYSSSAELMIFLGVLIVIAIAIPIAIQRKKQ